MKLSDIMKKAILVDANTTLKLAVKKMYAEDVNSVLVVDEEKKLIGTVDIVTLMKKIVPDYIGSRNSSVADFTTKEIFEGFIEDNESIKVKYFMLETPKIVKEDSSILKACMLATEGRQTKIPVVNDDQEPVGVITRSSVKSFLAYKMGF